MATAEQFNLDAIEPLSGRDVAALACHLGLDALPSYDRHPDFSRGDFTHPDNQGISFTGFVFGDGTWFGGATFGAWTRFEGWTGDELRALLERVHRGADAPAAGSSIEDRLKRARPGQFAQISLASAVFRG